MKKPRKPRAPWKRTAELVLEALEERLTPTFTPFPSIPVAGSTTLEAVASADFNKDGNTDLVFTDVGAAMTAFVVLGNGTGGALGAPIPLPTLTGTYFGVVTGDFNNDGNVDVAASRIGPTTPRIDLWQGNGAGGFTAMNPILLPGAANPFDITAGFFNGDANLDLAVSDISLPSINVLTGNGAFGFVVTPVAIGSTTTGITAGRINADTFTDLAVSRTDGRVSVLLNNGAGGFTETPVGGIPVGTNLRDVTAGYFNQDNILDLAVTDMGGGGQAFALTGIGNGTFNAPTLISAGLGSPQQLTTADFNRDHLDDLAITDSAVPGRMFVFLSQGTGAFAPDPSSPITVGGVPFGVATPDLNHDLLPDIVVGNGTAAAPALRNTTPSLRVYAAATAGGGPAAVEVYRPDGSLFTTITPFAGSAFTGAVSVAVGDVTGDGNDDIVVGKGPGQDPVVDVYSIATGAPVLVARFVTFAPAFRGGINVGVGYVNGDNKADIVVGAATGNAPHILVIDGSKLGMVGPDGQIQPAALLGSFYAFELTFFGGVTVGTGDVNGDRLADVIVGAGAGQSPHVIVVNATRLTDTDATGKINYNTALLASFYAFNFGFLGGVNVAGGDINGDGLADVLVGAAGQQGVNAHYRTINGARVNDVIVTPGPSLGSISDSALLDSFYAYSGENIGLRVAGFDLNGDGKEELMGAPGQGVLPLRFFQGAQGASPLPPAIRASLRDQLPFGGAYNGLFIGG